MIKFEHRRKLSNFIVDRPALLRLSLPFALMAGSSVGLVYIVGQRIMHALVRTELQGPENLAAINSLHQLQDSVTRLSTWGAIGVAALCLLMWFVVSHRIFGPMVPIRRHVRELLGGNYQSRVRLRRADEFRALAAELNQLAERLDASSGSRN